MNRMFTNLLVSDVSRSATFYETLLGMSRHFDSDWFVILTDPNLDGVEFGLLARDSHVVPDSARQAPAGVMVTFVVDDVDVIHERAKEQGLTVLQGPQDMFYGQRRMLVTDPDGTILDISAPVSQS